MDQSYEDEIQTQAEQIMQDYSQNDMSTALEGSIFPTIFFGKNFFNKNKS